MSTETGDTLAAIDENITPLQFSPDGRWIVGLQHWQSGPANMFLILDANTGKLHANLGLVDNLYGPNFIFQPDNETIVVQDVLDNYIEWNLISGESYGAVESDSDKVEYGLGVYSDNGMLLIKDGGAYDVSTGQKLYEFEPRDYYAMDEVVFSPNNKVVAVVSNYFADSSIHLFDGATGKLIKRLSMKTGVGNVLFTGDGKSIIWLNDDGKVRLWPLP